LPENGERFEHTITNHHLPFTNLRNLRQIFNQKRRGVRAKIPLSKTMILKAIILKTKFLKAVY
jgi:hypothetical protein